jgi:hypothetical protein
MHRPTLRQVVRTVSAIKHIVWISIAPRLERAGHDLHRVATDIEQFSHRTGVTDGLINLRKAARCRYGDGGSVGE